MTVPFRQKESVASVVARLQSDRHAPISAMIEIADRCNEVCVHCYQIQGQKGELETSDWKRILDEIAEMGVLFLTISGGEATLRHDFLELVTYARELKFAVKIYTNGLSMTRELAQKLADLAVQEVQISLYSHRAEVHDWVTRVPGSFEKTVAGACHLRDVGVGVVLKSPLMSFNSAEYQEYVAFISGLGIDYMLDPTLDPREDGDRDPQTFSIDDETWLKVKQDPTLTRVPEAPPEKDLERSLCGACSGSIHIEANGEMRPCTQLTVDVGRATEGVRDAYYGNGAAALIRDLRWKDIHGCRDCDLQPYCHRCFAVSRHEAGDALGPYAGACRTARLQYRLVHGEAPSIEAPPGRDAELGPYAEIEAGRFRTIEDVLTEDDRRLAEAHAWIRGQAAPAPEAGRPGELVQIRRPGQKARQERIPAGMALPQVRD